MSSVSLIRAAKLFGKVRMQQARCQGDRSSDSCLPGSTLSAAIEYFQVSDSTLRRWSRAGWVRDEGAVKGQGFWVLTPAGYRA